MKLQIVAIITLVGLVALAAGRAQSDNDTNSFFPDPDVSNGTEPGQGVESVDSTGDVGSVETFGFFPSIIFKPKPQKPTTNPWGCLCDSGIKFEDVHGQVCTCDRHLQSVCDAKFKLIKQKCFRPSSTSCRTGAMNDACSSAIRFYFKANCCVDQIDNLLVQARASMRWYGCGFCKDWEPCSGSHF